MACYLRKGEGVRKCHLILSLIISLTYLNPCVYFQVVHVHLQRQALREIERVEKCPLIFSLLIILTLKLILTKLMSFLFMNFSVSEAMLKVFGGKD